MNTIYNFLKLFFLGSFFIAILFKPFELFGQSGKTVSGMVLDRETGIRLEGASISLLGTNQVGITGDNGYFELMVESDSIQVAVRHIGYVSTIWSSTLVANEPILIRLQQVHQEIETVEVSTGYQMLPKERLTGSFGYVSNDEIERTQSRNILQRLEGKVSGIMTSSPGSNTMNIRGRNTILSNDQPLIVVDNFAYEGDIDLINPNDIESITVLKDAAASSIWGARASNGVIVITTKRGGAAGSSQITFRSNLTYKDRPDLFNISLISGADQIEHERYLFKQGYYTSFENNVSNPSLTPVVELFIAQRDGQIDGEMVEERLEQMKTYDIRRDFEKYMYRPSVTQQHSLSFRGGTGPASWYFSGGYDNGQANTVGSKSGRLSLRNNIRLQVNDKLTVDNAVVLTQNSNHALAVSTSYPTFNLGGSRRLYTYARLVDDAGNPLTLPKDYRDPFKEMASDAGLLDWSFNPLLDLESSNHYQVNSTDFIVKPTVTYNIVSGLNVSAHYQLQKLVTHIQRFLGEDTYEARTTINRYSQVANGGALTYGVPLGGIVNNTNDEMLSHQFRGQLSYNWLKNDPHALSGILGFEIRGNNTQSNSNRIYGFQERGMSSAPVDYKTRYKYYDSPLSGVVPDGQRMYEYVKRFVSYYTNLGYSYQKKYDVSASARIDQSNMFGVKTNKRMVPLWSMGLAWNIANENVFDRDLIPELRLRTTFGYNGNVSDATGITTVFFSRAYLNDAMSARVANPPNERLQWEKTQTLNVGLDFRLKPLGIRGSVEYYHKKNMNLLSQAAIDPTAGLGDINGNSVYTGNVATVVGNGVDLTIGAQWLQSSRFQWSSLLLFSIANHKVKEYYVVKTMARDYVNAHTSISPRIGYPVYAVYSYPWAGLNPENGNPIGSKDGVPTTDYNQIMNGPVEDLIYNGPARAPLFGNFRNRLLFKGVELDIQLAYRFGYYYRRSSIAYSTLNSTWTGHGDYALRWQKPGDEKLTQVPAFNYPVNNAANTYYLQSEALIERGDHIRIREIALRYRYRMLGISLHASNLGYVWLANSKKEDPFVENSLRERSTFALGLSIDL